ALRELGLRPVPDADTAGAARELAQSGARAPGAG
ncbi:prephenate dehydratase, partial [Frankia sp. CNm7]|nr:prephenate dehydratase [Frankia nepalensis]